MRRRGRESGGNEFQWSVVEEEVMVVVQNTIN
jgi:hypothetical protein